MALRLLGGDSPRAGSVRGRNIGGGWRRWRLQKQREQCRGEETLAYKCGSTQESGGEGESRNSPESFLGEKMPLDMATFLLTAVRRSTDFRIVFIYKLKAFCRGCQERKTQRSGEAAGESDRRPANKSRWATDTPRSRPGHRAAMPPAPAEGIILSSPRARGVEKERRVS